MGFRMKKITAAATRLKVATHGETFTATTRYMSILLTTIAEADILPNNCDALDVFVVSNCSRFPICCLERNGQLAFIMLEKRDRRISRSYPKMIRPVINWMRNKNSVRAIKSRAINIRSPRNVYVMFRKPKKPEMMFEMVSVATPPPPPTNEKTGMIALMPRPSSTLLTTASTVIRITCGVYAPYAFRYSLIARSPVLVLVSALITFCAPAQYPRLHYLISASYCRILSQTQIAQSIVPCYTLLTRTA